MKNDPSIEDRLLERGIRPTALRVLILREIMGMEEHLAFSLLDLENRLDTVDKSTIYRTINHFHKQLLIHSIDDGTGSIKYSLCSPGCDCSLTDSHIHFSCSNCHRTFCMEKLAIPKIKLPEGFHYDTVNFVFKGVCKECSSKGH